ncbi:MAG TPA: acyl-CoA thioesterase II [Acidimicrobiia bacterium]|nr:acyl-CoA thioesterase II [Acidimicrobiia bacterium]
MAASLPAVLNVDHLGEGRYSASHPVDDPEGRDIVFSGQILAQMIMASDHACEGAKDVKSIHAIFARAGTYSGGPMELQLESMHSGRAWGSDTITAYQGDRLLSRGLVLLNAIEPDLMRHGPEMPDVPGPESLPTDRGGTEFAGIEKRTVDDPKATAPDGAPALAFWMRNPESYDSHAANQAILAWCQPGSIIGLAMRPHGDVVNIGEAHRSVSTGVIAHTCHFHERFDVGEWLLVVQEATYAGRGRVNGSGAVFTQDGQLVSTFSQDSMARAVEGPLDPRRSM